MTAFFTIWVLRSPSTSVRKSSRRSDQRIPPRAIGPPRRCTPSRRGEYTKISKRGFGSGISCTHEGSSLRARHGRGPPSDPALVEVGAQGPVDELEVGTEDPVLVEARDRLEPPEDPLRDRVGRVALRGRGVVERRRNAGGLPPARGRSGRETGPRESRTIIRVGAQGVLHVGLAEAEADLPEVLRVGPEHGDLAPVEAGDEGEAVEAVVLRLARPHPGEAPLERLPRRLEVGVGRARALSEPEVVEPHRTARAVGAQLARVLVLHPKAHVLEHRERVREVDGAAEVEELEAERAGIGPGGPEEIHRKGPPGRTPALGPVPRPGRRRPRRPLLPASPAHERLGELDVAEGPVGAVPAAVAGSEHRLVAAAEGRPHLRPMPLGEHPGERPAPTPRRGRGSPVPGGGHGPSSSRVDARRAS